MNSKNIIVAFLIGITFIACNNDSEIKNESTTAHGSTDLTYQPNKRIIAPPIPSKEISFETYEINADIDNEIITENGTKIHLLKSSFIDAKGNLVRGNVSIQYRDYHNPLEVFLSGIPMNYDSNGVDYIFETAGMFEIRANQNSQPLSLKNDSKITIELVSSSNETDFNFYAFNENEGQWIYDAENRNMEIITTKTNSNENETIYKPVQQNTKKYAFDLAIDKTKFPELADYEGTLFEVTNPDEFQPLYYNVQWDNLNLQKTSKNNFQLQLFKEDTSITLNVTPVIKAQLYQQAIKKYNNKIEASKTKPRSEFDIYKGTVAYNSEMSPHTAIMRVISINDMGIYNVDKPGIFSPEKEVEELIVNNKDILKTNKNLMFYVSNLERNFAMSLYNKPKYYKKSSTILWAVLNEHEMVIVVPNQFETAENKKVIGNNYSIEEGLYLLNEAFSIN